MGVATTVLSQEEYKLIYIYLGRQYGKKGKRKKLWDFHLNLDFL